MRIFFRKRFKGQLFRQWKDSNQSSNRSKRKTIIEAENWMREKGVTKIYINSRKAALGFYEKLGYTADFSQVSGSGEFECVMTEKELA